MPTDAPESPPPLLLALEIAPLLGEFDWGIGGSLLLWKLGLETGPRDLDIVTTAAHFGHVSRRLAHRFGAGIQAPHPTFRSLHFAKFLAKDRAPIDLFAEVRVRRGDGLVSWSFNPQHLESWRGLPWMLPKDWLVLYELFDRRERVAALGAYLAGNPAQ